VLVCASCGHQNSEAARFCEACAAPLGGGSGERRKVVTVLSCDLVGSTALGESTDPEALRALLARYFERMKAVVEEQWKRQAPIGYLNTRELIDGREIRTVTIDPERAPLVQLAFELYATGQYSLLDLAAILEARGLKSRPTVKKPAKPLGTNRLSSMLRNEYYIGIVHYAGTTNPGRYQPLVEEAVFDAVQQILDAQRQSGERSWRHHHYLRGSLICADCGRRLFFVRPRGRNTTYEYFVCGGRSARLCTQPYHRVEAVEQAVERHYASIQLTDQQRERIRNAVHAHLDGLASLAGKETDRARAEVVRLDNEERKLLAAHYQDRISDHIFAEEQRRIRRERVAADQLLQRFEINHEDILETVEHALELTDNIQAAYLKADPTERRLLNQAFFRVPRDRQRRGSRPGACGTVRSTGAHQ
jgi:site-specific DNA recombinase